MTSVYLLGSEEQRQRWLPAMASCEQLGAFALTEPNHGSDVVSLDTRAQRDGDSYLLSGQKRWIGLGTLADCCTLADLLVVWARDDDGKVGAFVTEQPGRGQFVAGCDAQVITGKAANRAVWQTQITMDKVRVPAQDRLAITGLSAFA